MEQGQETDTENKERGGGLRALDGNGGGRNAACQEAAKINLIYIIFMRQLMNSGLLIAEGHGIWRAESDEIQWRRE